MGFRSVGGAVGDAYFGRGGDAAIGELERRTGDAALGEMEGRRGGELEGRRGGESAVGGDLGWLEGQHEARGSGAFGACVGAPPCASCTTWNQRRLTCGGGRPCRARDSDVPAGSANKGRREESRGAQTHIRQSGL